MNFKKTKDCHGLRVIAKEGNQKWKTSIHWGEDISGKGLVTVWLFDSVHRVPTENIKLDRSFKIAKAQ